MSATSKPESRPGPEFKVSTYNDENIESPLNASIVVNHPAKAFNTHIQHSPILMQRFDSIFSPVEGKEGIDGISVCMERSHFPLELVKYQL